MKSWLNYSAAARGVVLAAACVSFAACSLNTDVSGPGALIRYSGDQQSAAVNTPLPSPLQLLVVNQFGERLKNITVSWSIVNGGGTLSATTSLSDDSGIASVNYTTGPNPGVAAINGKVSGLLPLTFTATITAGP